MLTKSILVFTCLLLGLTVVGAQPRNRAKPPAPATPEANPQKAAALFEAGQEAHAAGKLEDAVNLYSQALELDSSLWQAEYQRAAAYFSLQRLPEATSSINKVMELLKEFSDSPDLKQVSAKAQTLRGEIAFASHQLLDAEVAFRRALELDANHQRAHSGLGQVLIANNKVAEAIAAAKAAMVAGDDSALIYSLLGHAQFRSKQNDDALANLTEALKREPNNPQALRDRAEVFLARNDVTRAAADLQALLAVEKSTATMFRLAALYRTSKQYDDATKLYQQVANADPSNQEARTALAEILIESGKAENAVAELEALIKINPNRADLRSQLATLLVVNQPDKALEQYQEAAKLAPDNLNHRLGIGSALVKLKRFDDAIATLKPVLSQSLKDDQMYTARANIATALFELKDYPNAAREYIWLLDYLAKRGEQKKTAVTTYLLGVCFDKFGDFEQALKAYQQFLSLATSEQQLEIEKVKLRLPSLQRQIAQGQGIKRKK
ncbi:MAG: tetratricopeptide repeat protein [Blastocatellia bacterium]|nr:tetratricopeptide repeat protein [Blastocatellia bacterium]